jgi:hypothetical protein
MSLLYSTGCCSRLVLLLHPFVQAVCAHLSLSELQGTIRLGLGRAGAAAACAGCGGSRFCSGIKCIKGSETHFEPDLVLYTITGFSGHELLYTMLPYIKLYQRMLVLL